MKYLLLFVLSTSLAFGNCNLSYKKKSVEIEKKYKQKKQSASTMSTIGAGALSLHSIMAPIAPLSTLMTTTTAGQLYLYGALIKVSLSTSDYIVKQDLDWIKKILDQSAVEFGKDLELLASDLSKEMNKKVTAQEVAWVVDEANKFNHFCPKKNILMTKRQFIKYLQKVIEPMTDFNAPIGWRELRIHHKRSLGL